jgi:hypothetical protein
MPQVQFDSLTIKQFRSFKHLEIERLGQVNLIVGMNGVGKTCLIEALRANAYGGSPWILRQLLVERDEVIRGRQREPFEEVDSINKVYEAVTNLFYGRSDVWSYPQGNALTIAIGPHNQPDKTLEIEPVSLEEEIDADRVRRYRRLEAQPGISVLSETDFGNGTIDGLAVRNGLRNEQLYALFRMFDRPYVIKHAPVNFPIVFVPAQGVSSDDVRSLWSKTTLTGLEEHVNAALSIVSPTEIEAVNVVSISELSYNQRVIAKIRGTDSPVPLRSLGEGVARAFGLALSLVNSRDGILAVDEIDSGLHHSVQYELWKLILNIAKQLGVQVFATTHSWDCVAAFQEAAGEDGEVEGLLIRLERKGDDIVPTLFGERELSIATREQIEVR